MTRQLRGERTATRLLDTALAEHERDPAGFGVPAVLAASGASAGSLYHHFGSLDGLVAALYARSMTELLDALCAAVLPAATARGGIEGLVRAYLLFASEHPAPTRVVHTRTWTAFAPEHVATVAAAKAPRIDALLAWVRPHQVAGEVVDLPPALLETVLIGPPAEAVRRRLGGVPGVDLAEAAVLLPPLVWRSVQA